jgi:hypothetical protein
MIRKTLWHHPFLLKFDRCEGFHLPPLTYDAQITVCPVKVFSRQNFELWVSIRTVLFGQEMN